MYCVLKPLNGIKKLSVEQGVCYMCEAKYKCKYAVLRDLDCWADGNMKFDSRHKTLEAAKKAFLKCGWPFKMLGVWDSKKEWWVNNDDMKLEEQRAEANYS